MIRDIKDLATKFLFKNSPFYVQFQLTDKCNLNCRFCSVPGNLKQYSELGLNEIKKVASNLAKINTTNLILTGGEPFFRKDLPEIIKIAKEYIPHVRLQSNGLLINEKNLQQCIGAGLDGITISFDSVDPETQDFINDQAGSFEQLIEKIVLVNNLFPQDRDPLALNATISPLNCQDLKTLVSFADEIDWMMALVPVHTGEESKQSNDFMLRKNHSGQKLTKDIINTACDDLMGLKKRGSNISNSKKYLKFIRIFMTDNVTSWRHSYKGNVVCDSPNLYFGIRPNGEFAICHDFPFSEKLLVQNPSFVDRYKSSLFDDVKKEAAECHGCYYGCYPEYTWMFNNPFQFAEIIFMYAKNLFTSKRRHLDKDELMQKILQKKLSP